jgi:hypothetical protein
MKKADIKAGVVYAYQRSDNYSPEPVVFLSTDLYIERGRLHVSTAALEKAQPGEKPGKDYMGRNTGYPAVFRSFDAEGTPEEVIAAMLSATLDGAIADKLPRGVKSEVVTTLTRIRGPYGEVRSAYLAAQAADLAERYRRDAAAASRRSRAVAAAAVFTDVGVYSTPRGSEITLTLENAEKLAALLVRVGLAASPDKPEEG